MENEFISTYYFFWSFQKKCFKAIFSSMALQDMWICREKLAILPSLWVYTLHDKSAMVFRKFCAFRTSFYSTMGLVSFVWTTLPWWKMDPSIRSTCVCLFNPWVLCISHLSLSCMLYNTQSFDLLQESSETKGTYAFKMVHVAIHCECLVISIIRHGLHGIFLQYHCLSISNPNMDINLVCICSHLSLDATEQWLYFACWRKTWTGWKVNWFIAAFSWFESLPFTK